jgi:hypothetical protein
MMNSFDAAIQLKPHLVYSYYEWQCSSHLRIYCTMLTLDGPSAGHVRSFDQEQLEGHGDDAPKSNL